MPKITAASIALTALIMLGLTGCAGTADNAGDASTAPEATAPLVAETATPAEEMSEDEEFLQRVRESLPEDTVIPDATDEQLLTAATGACEQMNSGTDVAAVNVIEGEEPNELDIYESSAAIAGVAKDVYCPQGY